MLPVARALGALSVVGAAFITQIAMGGDLNPPAGPIAPTPGPEPRIAINSTNTPGDANTLYKILQPGSYYLTGNITGVVGKHGITISSNNVTLDLNGFRLAGVPAMGVRDGVIGAVIFQSIAVINGSVSGWGGDGVDLNLNSNCRVAGVLAQDNANWGILVSGGSTITNCSTLANLVGGILANGNTAVINCTADSNSTDGIRLSSGSWATGCSSTFNGAKGIGAVQGCTITGCTMSSNTGSGIGTADYCTITNCSARGNGGGGIVVGTGCTVSNCSASGNNGISPATGITAGTGSTVSNCTASSNTADGMSVASGCTITGCTAAANANNGISVGDGCTINGCTAHSNTLDGIRVTARCLVRGNTCHLNGLNAGNGAGIHTVGAGNRLEGNSCTSADRGIDVDSTGSIIVCNTCAGNTNNWDVVAGNVALVVNATTSAAISGNSGGTAPGSTDPNANFTH